MTAAETLKELESLGSEQTRTTYKRHGVKGPLFGVSYASLGKLVKKIKVDHELAQALWASGNYDARILATMIADPRRGDSKLADAWAKDLDCHTLTGALANYLGQTSLARAKMEKWTTAKGECIACTGWHLLSFLSTRPSDLPDALFENYLAIIEKEIQQSRNRVKQAMNGALISIGQRKPPLKKKALAVAKKIGKVHIDHGDTDCKTPDAAAYIEKAWARKASKGERG